MGTVSDYIIVQTRTRKHCSLPTLKIEIERESQSSRDWTSLSEIERLNTPTHREDNRSANSNE